MKFDELLNHLGDFGRYQKLQFLLVCLPTIFTAMHALTWTFSAAHLPHRCKLLEEDDGATYWTNSSLLAKTDCDISNPADLTSCRYKECQLGEEYSCPYGYVFDRSEIYNSALNKWEIVCKDSVWKAVIQSAYYVGQMAGSVVCGFLGDRIGRKKVFSIALVTQIGCGLLMAIAPHWAVYGILRAGVGFAHPGIFVIAVVIGMELLGPSKRKIASVLTGMCFALGQAILGVLAYFIRDYQYLQAAIAVPTLVFISYFWIIPESARWLVSQRRFKEANEILSKAARMNKASLPDKWWEEIEIAEEKSGSKIELNKKYNFFDLIRTPKMRSRTIGTFICWPVVSMIYYGVSMNTSFLGGNLYTTFIFGAIMEIPALFLVYLLIDRIGRKPLLAAGYLTSALCMLSNLVITEDAHWIFSMVQFLVIKGAITSSYATIYTFTPELFPTVIRNTAVGCCSMIARIGAILASYIAMWLVEVYGKELMIVPFGTAAIIAFLVVVFMLPETVGRPLPETIQQIECGEEPVMATEMEPLAKEE
uniref:MFS domain-containing protein n=1 Tax=Steinernema glaseri TaxID=37863 RepID=A0A1I7YS92_9BILA